MNSPPFLNWHANAASRSSVTMPFGLLRSHTRIDGGSISSQPLSTGPCLYLGLENKPRSPNSCNGPGHCTCKHNCCCPNLRPQIFPTVRLNQCSSHGTSSQACKSCHAKSHPNPRAKLAEVVRERRERNQNERLDGIGEETVKGGKHVDSFSRVPNTNLTV